MDWKQPVIDYCKSDAFNCFFDEAKNSFVKALEWVKEWGCSRNYGLGTKLPWDEQFVIESLSDSTIYYAYYTIAHYLQGNVIGSEQGTFGIKPEQMTEQVYDYIFLGEDFNS